MRTFALILTACCAGAVAASEPPSAVLEYEVRYGPLQVMAFRTTARFESGGYQARTDVRTVGIVGALFPWTATSSASGIRNNGAMQPRHFYTAGEYRGVQRVAEIEYDAGGGVRARIDPPPEADDRDPVAASMQHATIDPITAGLAAVTSGCRGTQRIFDGRRRFDLVLSDLGETDTPSSRHTMYSGRSRHCRGMVKPLGGFWRSAPNQDERPTQVDAWIAAPRPGMGAVPVYLEVSAPRGTLAIHLAATKPFAAFAPDLPPKRGEARAQE
jgi:hypothetical protein